MLTGLDAVLSEETLNLHKEYLKKLKLKYSIFEKSRPEISGKGMCEISKMRIAERDEILYLMRDIKSHELYFNSFDREFQSSDAVRKRFRSEASFVYELYKTAMESDGDFLLVTANKGELDYEVLSEKSFLKAEPLLAVDLCEHAYFMDFGFEKEEYLKKILYRLNLKSLDKILLKRD